jgi:hypothetical protein
MNGFLTAIDGVIRPADRVESTCRLSSGFVAIAPPNLGASRSSS